MTAIIVYKNFKKLEKYLVKSNIRNNTNNKKDKKL